MKEQNQEIKLPPKPSEINDVVYPSNKKQQSYVGEVEKNNNSNKKKKKGKVGPNGEEKDCLIFWNDLNIILMVNYIINLENFKYHHCKV